MFQSLWGRAIESTMIMNIMLVCHCFDILILYQKGQEQPDGIGGLKILRYSFQIANLEEHRVLMILQPLIPLHFPPIQRAWSNPLQFFHPTKNSKQLRSNPSA